MSVILNNIEPVVLENIPLDWSDCPAQFHKYVKFKEQNWMDVDYRAVYILDEMAKYLTHDYKSIYFDFKVYDLKEGGCGCPLPDWHIDVTPNPNHPTKECRHLIYTTKNMELRFYKYHQMLYHYIIAVIYIEHLS